jgi:hypothetical protein
LGFWFLELAVSIFSVGGNTMKKVLLSFLFVLMMSESAMSQILDPCLYEPRRSSSACKKEKVIKHDHDGDYADKSHSHRYARRNHEHDTISIIDISNFIEKNCKVTLTLGIKCSK